MADSEDKKKPDPLYKKYKKMPYRELALRMKALTDQIKVQDDATKILKAEFDLIRLVVVPERFLEEEVSSTNLTGIGRLSITGDMQCTQIKDKKEDFFEWMHEKGYGDLIKPDINTSSLKALVKSLRDSEDEEEQKQYITIQDYLNIHVFSRASLTKT